MENQLTELRSYVERRGWTAVEYVDKGVSGAKDRRPSLDELLKAARRRRFDVLVCWRLDRLGRNLRHLILLLDELQALGIAFVTLGEGIDTSTPADGCSSMSCLRLRSSSASASENECWRDSPVQRRRGSGSGDLAFTDRMPVAL